MPGAPHQLPQTKKQRRGLMPSGTVKWFNAMKGFGFVEPDDGGKDVFLHISAVERSGIGTPREGQRISYDLERDQRGRVSATNLRAAE
jgi:cold shock protein